MAPFCRETVGDDGQVPVPVQDPTRLRISFHTLHPLGMSYSPTIDQKMGSLQQADFVLFKVTLASLFCGHVLDPWPERVSWNIPTFHTW